MSRQGKQRSARSYVPQQIDLFSENAQNDRRRAGLVGITDGLRRAIEALHRLPDGP